MVFDTTTIIGTSSALILLAAFVLNQIKKWKNDYVIDAFNFVGSLLLVIYAIILSSVPFTLFATLLILWEAYYWLSAP